MGIVNKLRHLFTKLFFKARIRILTLNKSIKIQSGNRIYPSTRIKTNCGGEISIGKNNELLYGVCLMTYGGSIKIGDNCSINPYTIIYGHGKGLQIGDNVLIAGHCMIIPSNHNFTRTDIPINQQGESSKGIIIEDDVWLGTGVKVLDGVTIGKGSIVAAGAVVNKNVDAHCVYAGVPAKKIKKRE